MRTMSAKDAKNRFGALLDYARAAPVQVEKHGRPVVVVMSVEEFQRLNKPVSQPDDAMRKTVKVDR
ncbi:type II toxin-antitoxin system Phd/YefM family antitoxin [Gluconacetobacter diazotrophicus]|uniref:Antitoxin n=1 Tax=Gluconacetobacter diazotrophicus TaxID=33996 RepID=A0A7W4FF62_GLUDI|nr:type II toxin-antitoxin system Phd/YefM family antitoxin [Gluconacetobacter diazotrophicus]MBB2156532.1 type II toxin-antitoxin system Phd/YefM family antitoxin [Gluconacetobacter diazotrophicus]